MVERLTFNQRVKVQVLVDSLLKIIILLVIRDECQSGLLGLF